MAELPADPEVSLQRRISAVSAGPRLGKSELGAGLGANARLLAAIAFAAVMVALTMIFI